jgi:hypothetical protein
MNAHCLEFDLPADSLQGVVEPLASYICAARHPHEALRWVLKALRTEVEQTHRAARKHVNAFAAER